MHTKGEWIYKITKASQELFDCEEIEAPLCTIYVKNDKAIARSVIQANARLITAAPKMLSALKKQHQAIDILFAMLIETKKDFFPSKSGLPWEAIQEGNQIINKAESK